MKPEDFKEGATVTYTGPDRASKHEWELTGINAKDLGRACARREIGYANGAPSYDWDYFDFSDLELVPEETTITVPKYVKHGYAQIIKDFAADPPDAAKVLKQAKHTLCTIFQNNSESLSLHGYHKRVCDFLYDLEMEHKNSEIVGPVDDKVAAVKSVHMSHAILYPEGPTEDELQAKAEKIVGETIQPGSRDYFVGLVHELLKEIHNA